MTPRGPRRLRGEEMLRAGHRDIDVARELSVSPEAVRQWREALGIPSGRSKSLRLLQQKYITDNPQAPASQLAKVLGCSTPTIYKWRKKLNTPFVRSHPRRDQAIREILEGKLPLATIAANAGVKHHTVVRWRSMLGLGRKRRKISGEMAEKFLAAVEQTSSVRIAAQQLGYFPETVARWVERARQARSEKKAP